VPGTTHLFGEPGAIENVVDLTGELVLVAPAARRGVMFRNRSDPPTYVDRNLPGLSESTGNYIKEQRPAGRELERRRRVYDGLITEFRFEDINAAADALMSGAAIKPVLMMP
jgi:hypothetical protein